MAPTLKIEGQAPHLEGHVKVELTYVTITPKSDASKALRSLLGFAGPYSYSVHILILAKHAYSLIQAHQDAFDCLMRAGVVPDDAHLTAYAMAPMDDTTIAYVIHE